MAFSKWCLLHGLKDELKAHFRMKPVVGTRYFVYHYNPRIIFHLRQVYLQFIEHVRASKKPKPGLNRLEASVKKLLEDQSCIAQMRAAAILCEQIEQPILWLAKCKSALDMREVSAHGLCVCDCHRRRRRRAHAPAAGERTCAGSTRQVGHTRGRSRAHDAPRYIDIAGFQGSHQGQ